MPEKTIFLIHQDPHAREVIQACLSDLGGWNVLDFAAPEVAAKKAFLIHPDAILIAVSPEIDIIKFLQIFRSYPITVKTPILLLLDGIKWLNPELLKPFQIAGSINFLVNPINLPEQISLVLNWQRQHG